MSSNNYDGEEIFKAILTAVLTTTFFALLFMVIWNFFIPALFITAPSLTYFQALGILILGRIIS